MKPTSVSPTIERMILPAAIGLGLLLHCYAASRTWIGGDEAHLLRLGAALSSQGTIIPFAKLLSGGGTNPGILLQLFFGVPMYLFEHFRSPMILVVIMHCAAYALTASILKEAFDQAIVLGFTILYWLSPWRIYYGSLLWEPAFIYLPAAIQFWSCYKSRNTPSFVHSMFCIASIAWAMQIHNSAIILLLSTGLLFWKKQIKLHWGGVICGVLLGGLTLIPSIVAVIGGNLQYDTQQSQGFVGKGLLTVAPTLKGVLYWFNLGAVEMVRNLKETSFAQASHPIAIYILQGLCILTVIPSIFASWWYYRPLWKFKGKKIVEHELTPERQWIRGYTISMLISLVCAAALSPIVLQGWMVVIVLSSAVIPVSVWICYHLSVKLSSYKLKLGLVLYALFEIAIMLILVSGMPIFNRTSDLPDAIDPHRDSLLIHYIPPLN
jgi:hypothetical protein